jgi:hypothetical protein
LNPASVLGYIAGKQRHWALKILFDTAVLLGILILVAKSGFPALENGVEIRGSSLILLEALLFLAGTAAGELRSRWVSNVEIYYLTASNGLISAFSLLASTTYLHLTLVLA